MAEGFDGFRIYDMSAWPIVMLRSGAQVPGYAAQWAQEMDALLARQRPFVMLHGAQAENEVHEDRRVRAIWLKQNKAALAEHCRALVHVEPNPARRLAIRAEVAIAVRVFKVPMEIVASFEEALTVARRALDGTDAQEQAHA